MLNRLKNRHFTAVLYVGLIALCPLPSFADPNFSSPFVRNRPVFAEKAAASIAEMKKEKWGAAGRVDLVKDCPASNAYAKKVLLMIAEKNGLLPFIQSDYGPDIVVFCGEPAGESITKLDSVIQLSGGDILAMDDEDEVAFIIAHEFSHVSMGHLELDIANAYGLAIDNKGLNPETIEYEADNIGTQLLAGAGLDPNAAYDGLRKIRKSIGGEFFMGMDLGSRSKFGERQKRIGDYLKQMNFEKKSRQDSAEFENIKNELRALSKH